MQGAWAAVVSAFVTTRQCIRDTSTGIHALDKGYGSGRPRRGLSVDEDKYNSISRNL